MIVQEKFTVENFHVKKVSGKIFSKIFNNEYFSS